MPETAWEKTRKYSANAYSRAFKPGFDRAWQALDKLGTPANRLSNKLGAEAFWPTTLDKESEKAARILRSFCKDGFYEGVDALAAAKAEQDGGHVEGPQGKQRVLKKIPEHVVREAKGLAIFTTMRTGLWISGAGGSGVLVARNQETGEWSPPSGILLHTAGLGFMVGVDIYDCVVIINTYQALQAFTKLRCTLGGEVSAAAGPLSIGGMLETEVHKRQAPVWTYLKSRGFYAGVQIDGTIVIERSDENERFYGERVPVADILAGKVRNPPTLQYQILSNTLRAAQGDFVDERLLPNVSELTPGDQELEQEVSTFGIPEIDDPDPYGVKALETQGILIREAATQERPSATAFEFKPATTSPIYATFARKSMDGSAGRRASTRNSWRASIASVASRGTQTDEDASPMQSPVSKNVPRLSNPIQETAVRSSDKEEALECPTIKQEISATKAIIDGSGVLDNLHEKTASEKGALDESSSEKVASDKDSIEHTTESSDEHDDDDDYENSSFDRSGASTPDPDEEIEIHEAKPVIAQAKVVTIPKRLPPSLPPRNPQRMSTQSKPRTESFTSGVDDISLGSDRNSVREDQFQSMPPSPSKSTNI